VPDFPHGVPQLFRAETIPSPSQFFLLQGPAADATDAPQPLRLFVQPYEEDDEDGEVFYAFPF
jgi:hypothetical protein